MKSIITLMIGMVLSISVNAQWTTGTDIYNTSNGKVGIGTNGATLQSKLEVNGDVRCNQKFVITNVGAFDRLSTDIFISANNNLLLTSGGSATAKVTILSNGSVGIGATNIDHKLTVAGHVGAREVKVTVDMGSDFVFNDDYKLKSLNEVEKFIKENHHLPNVASAKEMETNGIELGKMDMKLLEKIEELTLYMIDLKKEVEKVNKENQILKEEISTLKQK